MYTVEKALEDLREAGIYSEFKNGSVPEIFGGKDVNNIGEIKVFKKAFNICFEDELWVARLPGEGQMVTELKFENLDEAVNSVKEYFLNT